MDRHRVELIPDFPAPGRYEVRGFVSALAFETCATWPDRKNADDQIEHLIVDGYSQKFKKRYARVIVFDTYNNLPVTEISRPRKTRGK